MNPIHPTPEQIDRYRTRVAPADELIAVDQHLAECDRCHATLARVATRQAGLPVLQTDSGESEHLTYEEMEQWLDGRADDVERELIEGHRDICDLCRNELADLARVRDAMRGAERGASKQGTFARVLLPIAAIIAIAAVGGLLLLQKDLEDTRSRLSGQPGLPVLQRPAVIADLAGNASALRNGEDAHATFSLMQPVATVVLDPRPQLRWEPVAGAGSYTVTVVDADTGEVSFTGVSRTDSLQLDRSLERGRPYSWQVAAHRGDEVITAPRPPTPEVRFRVATKEQADAIAALPKEAHLQRGISLAKLGILDDAERELTLAREPEARGLLDRVRSWRQS
jgi:hypothetical protein